MKRILALLAFTAIIPSVQAQDNALANAIRQQNTTQQEAATDTANAKKTGTPVAIAPIVYDETVGTDAQEKLNGMLETLSALLEKNPKTRLEDDTTKIRYLVAMGVSRYEQGENTVYDRKTGQAYDRYSVSFYLTLYLWDYKEKRIAFQTGSYKESHSSVKGYDEALRALSTITPAQGRVRELVEGGLKVTGRVARIDTDSKGKAVAAVVDKGSDDGIIDTQWFDVYVEGDTTHVLGTLHADAVKAGETTCKLRKNKEQMVKAYNEGLKLVAVSREESNAWKAIGRLGDRIR